MLVKCFAFTKQGERSRVTEPVSRCCLGSSENLKIQVLNSYKRTVFLYIHVPCAWEPNSHENYWKFLLWYEQSTLSKKLYIQVSICVWDREFNSLMSSLSRIVYNTVCYVFFYISHYPGCTTLLIFWFAIPAILVCTEKNPKKQSTFLH